MLDAPSGWVNLSVCVCVCVLMCVDLSVSLLTCIGVSVCVCVCVCVFARLCVSVTLKSVGSLLTYIVIKANMYYTGYKGTNTHI